MATPVRAKWPSWIGVLATPSEAAAAADAGRPLHPLILTSFRLLGGLGGFDPGVSDIDLVAVIAPEVEAPDVAGRERMQHQFISRHPACWCRRPPRRLVPLDRHADRTRNTG
jgi:hypothetical protein